MSAHEIIRDTIAQMVHDIDGKRWSALPSLFADQVDSDYTSLFGGQPLSQPRAELIAGWQKMLGSEVSTQHLLGPIVVRENGMQASAACHVHATHRRGEKEWLVLGHYELTLVHDGDWHISGLKLVTFHERGDRKVVQP